jgi:ABC-2 type transport system permease protein
VAGLIFSAQARGQFAAIARLRWQLFVNSLRTLRGRLEMVSRIFIGLAFGIGGLGGAVVLALVSYALIAKHQAAWTTLLLWIVFLFWQLFPLMATALSENFDSSSLLRFPLSYRSFFLVRLVYGSFDPGTALGALWLLGILVGISVANASLFVPAAIILGVFGLMNILLARVIFAWVERWLAQRRTREIMGFVFLIVIISFQFIGPLSARWQRRRHPQVGQITRSLLPLERALPPGVSGSALTQLSQAQFGRAAASFAALCAYGIALFLLLNVRMVALYRGENLSEAAAPVKRTRGKLRVRAGWDVPLVSGPVAAIFEKELRYISRSGPVLFQFVMPVIILLIFRVTPSRTGSLNIGEKAGNFAFPIGALYAVLILANVVYNNFGADGAGVQFWFVAPVRLRDVVRAKNLVHASIVAAEMALLWVAVGFIFRPPTLAYTAATIAAAIFMTPINLAVGNLFSIYSPKKFDFGAFGRQRPAQTTTFASLLAQVVMFGLIAAAYGVGRLWGGLWLTTLLLLVLAAIALVGYSIVLGRIDGIALARRETLISELSRA